MLRTSLLALILSWRLVKCAPHAPRYPVLGGNATSSLEFASSTVEEGNNSNPTETARPDVQGTLASSTSIKTWPIVTPSPYAWSDAKPLNGTSTHSSTTTLHMFPSPIITTSELTLDVPNIRTTTTDAVSPSKSSVMSASEPGASTQTMRTIVPLAPIIEQTRISLDVPTPDSTSTRAVSSLHAKGTSNSLGVSKASAQHDRATHTSTRGVSNSHTKAPQDPPNTTRRSGDSGQRSEMSRTSTRPWVMFTPKVEKTGLVPDIPTVVGHGPATTKSAQKPTNHHGEHDYIVPTTYYAYQHDHSSRVAGNGASERVTLTVMPKPIIKSSETALDVPGHPTKSPAGSGSGSSSSEHIIAIVPGSDAKDSDFTGTKTLRGKDGVETVLIVPTSSADDLPAETGQNPAKASSIEDNTSPLLPHAFALGSKTLSAGSSAIVEEGTTYSLSPSGNVLFVNGAAWTVPTDATATAEGEGTAPSFPLKPTTVPSSDKLPHAYAFGSKTLFAGSSAVVEEGTTYSLSPTGNVIYVDGVAWAVPTDATADLEGDATAMGFRLEPTTVPSAVKLPQVYTLGSQVLSAGSPGIVKGGTTYSLSPSGSVVYVNGSPSPATMIVASASDNEKAGADEGDSLASAIMGGLDGHGGTAGSVSATETAPLFTGVPITSKAGDTATAAAAAATATAAYGPGSNAGEDSNSPNNGSGSTESTDQSPTGTESAVAAVQTNSGAFPRVLPGLGVSAIIAIGAFL